MPICGIFAHIKIKDMRNLKRTKQVQEMVNHVNRYLEANCVKDERDDMFSVMCDLLIHGHMYDGYNYYVHKRINGENRLILSGTGDKKKFDCLQIW